MNRSVAFRYGEVVAILTAIIAMCFATTSSTLANDLENAKIDKGKQLFIQQWQHDDYQDPVLQGTNISGNPNEVGDGLGPMLNATSCVACHEAGGAAGIEHNVVMLTLDPRSEVFSREHSIGDGRRDLMSVFPGVFSTTGQVTLDLVVHAASTRPGYEAIRSGLAAYVPGGIPDAWFEGPKRNSAAIAETPVIAGRHGSVDFYLSQRNSLPLFGLGLIDKISMSQLDLIAARQRRSTRGIVSGHRGAGKFGWRAQTASLGGFVRGACTAN